MNDVHPAGQLFKLDRSRCLALLATQEVGRLVGGNSDSPVIVVNYVLDGDDIVVRVDTESPAVTIGDVVVFEVDAFDERTRSGWSVIVRGVARDVITTDGPDRAVVDTWAPRADGRSVAIQLAEVTGRLLRGGDDGVSRVDPRAYL
jgi:nitroimidazol reductase NimA-like FMN-containing flavoprotein (pyridoxamine 5'-phosphate oxidase superfamily)